MSKAFDILDHTILIAKLKYYGITGIPLDLFMSYLSNRIQYVDFKGIKSNTLDIKTGVPQGSILGPLLFIIVSNDFSKSSNCLTLQFMQMIPVYPVLYVHLILIQKR